MTITFWIAIAVAIVIIVSCTTITITYPDGQKSVYNLKQFIKKRCAIGGSWRESYEFACKSTKSRANLHPVEAVLSFTFDNFMRIYQTLPQGSFIVDQKEKYSMRGEYVKYLIIKGRNKKKSQTFYVIFDNWKDYKKFYEYILNAKDQAKKEEDVKNQAEALTYLLDEIKQVQQKTLNTIDSCKDELKEMNHEN